MNRPFFPLIAALALALSGAAGCAPDRMSLEPYCVCAMPDNCSFSGGCDACSLGTQTGNGTAPLYAAIELRNQAPNNEDLKVGRVNTNDAHVTGYAVTFAGGGPAGFTVYEGTQPVPAGGSGVVIVKLAPIGAVGKYTSQVSFIGYYDNGREFETEPFPVGVEIVSTATFPCSGTDVDVCPGTGAQGNRACGTL